MLFQCCGILPEALDIPLEASAECQLPEENMLLSLRILFLKDCDHPYPLSTQLSCM
jgi:hypothetical protein